MRRGHHLSDYEIDWSKKVPNRNEILKKCSKQTRKFHPNVLPINLDPYYGSVGAGGKQLLASREAIPISEASSTTFNYVISEDHFPAEHLPATARTVDLKPAKSIATNNLSRITGVLRRAQEIDCRSSILYASNRLQDSTEPARPGSPGSTKSSFVMPDQPGADGIIIGAQLNWLRPTTSATEEERDKYARGRQLRQTEEKRKAVSTEYRAIRTDPWPYFYRMSLDPPVPRVADHHADWNVSFITGTSLSRPATQQQQPETNNFRSDIEQFSTSPHKSDNDQSPLKSVNIDLENFNESMVNIEANIVAVQMALKSNSNSRGNSLQGSVQGSRNASAYGSRRESRDSMTSLKNEGESPRKGVVFNEVALGMMSLPLGDILHNAHTPHGPILSTHTGHGQQTHTTHPPHTTHPSHPQNDPNLKSIIEQTPKTTHPTALLPDDAEDLWESLMFDLRATSYEMNYRDLAEIAAMKKPEEAVVTVVGYLCVLLNVEPVWNVARSTILRGLIPLLKFLREVEPDSVPTHRLQAAVLHRAERIQALGLTMESMKKLSKPIGKLMKWIHAFNVTSLLLLAAKDGDDNRDDNDYQQIHGASKEYQEYSDSNTMDLYDIGESGGSGYGGNGDEGRERGLVVEKSLSMSPFLIDCHKEFKGSVRDIRMALGGDNSDRGDRGDKVGSDDRGVINGASKDKVAERKGEGKVGGERKDGKKKGREEGKEGDGGEDEYLDAGDWEVEAEVTSVSKGEGKENEGREIGRERKGDEKGGEKEGKEGRYVEASDKRDAVSQAKDSRHSSLKTATSASSSSTHSNNHNSSHPSSHSPSHPTSHPTSASSSHPTTQPANPSTRPSGKVSNSDYDFDRCLDMILDEESEGLPLKKRKATQLVPLNRIDKDKIKEKLRGYLVYNTKIKRSDKFLLRVERMRAANGIEGNKRPDQLLDLFQSLEGAERFEFHKLSMDSGDNRDNEGNVKREGKDDREGTEVRERGGKQNGEVKERKKRDFEGSKGGIANGGTAKGGVAMECPQCVDGARRKGSAKENGRNGSIKDRINEGRKGSIKESKDTKEGNISYVDSSLDTSIEGFSFSPSLNPPDSLNGTVDSFLTGVTGGTGTNCVNGTDTSSLCTDIINNTHNPYNNTHRPIARGVDGTISHSSPNYRHYPPSKYYAESDSSSNSGHRVEDIFGDNVASIVAKVSLGQRSKKSMHVGYVSAADTLDFYKSPTKLPTGKLRTKLREHNKEQRKAKVTGSTSSGMREGRGEREGRGSGGEGGRDLGSYTGSQVPCKQSSYDSFFDYVWDPIPGAPSPLGGGVSPRLHPGKRSYSDPKIIPLDGEELLVSKGMGGGDKSGDRVGGGGGDRIGGDKGVVLPTVKLTSQTLLRLSTPKSSSRIPAAYTEKKTMLSNTNNQSSLNIVNVSNNTRKKSIKAPKELAPLSPHSAAAAVRKQSITVSAVTSDVLLPSTPIIIADTAVVKVGEEAEKEEEEAKEAKGDWGEQRVSTIGSVDAVYGEGEGQNTGREEVALENEKDDGESGEKGDESIAKEGGKDDESDGGKGDKKDDNNNDNKVESVFDESVDYYQDKDFQDSDSEEGDERTVVVEGAVLSVMKVTQNLDPKIPDEKEKSSEGKEKGEGEKEMGENNVGPMDSTEKDQKDEKKDEKGEKEEKGGEKEGTPENDGKEEKKEEEAEDYGYDEYDDFKADNDEDNQIDNKKDDEKVVEKVDENKNAANNIVDDVSQAKVEHTEGDDVIQFGVEKCDVINAAGDDVIENNIIAAADADSDADLNTWQELVLGNDENNSENNYSECYEEPLTVGDGVTTTEGDDEERKKEEVKDGMVEKSDSMVNKENDDDEFNRDDEEAVKEVVQEVVTEGKEEEGENKEEKEKAEKEEAERRRKKKEQDDDNEFNHFDDEEEEEEGKKEEKQDDKEDKIDQQEKKEQQEEEEEDEYADDTPFEVDDSEATPKGVMTPPYEAPDISLEELKRTNQTNQTTQLTDGIDVTKGTEGEDNVIENAVDNKMGADNIADMSHASDGIYGIDYSGYIIVKDEVSE